MNDKIYKLAHELTEYYFDKCCYMDVLGAKVVDNYMYVKGGDNGFPHTRAHVKIDLQTNKIVSEYGAHDCPVYVEEGNYC